MKPDDDLCPDWPAVPRDRLTVEFFLPAPDLRPMVSGYNIYGSYGPEAGKREIFFPGWTTVRFNFNQGPWSIRYGQGRKEMVTPCAIFGASANDIQSEDSPRGLSIGFGVTPLGMARLFREPASRFAGCMTALEDVWPDAHAIRREIAALPDISAVPALFDNLLRARLRPPSRDAALVTRLAQILVQQHDTDVRSICEELGCSDATLRRLALRHFGFPPKLLLRRSRFLKSLMAIIGQPPGRWSQLIDASYFDQSHFIKDCHEFLNSSPSDFLSQPRPMTALSMAQRNKILGAPVMTLHQSAPPPPAR